MLKQLHIKNLALIEECDLELHDGLNIITGETGAGKSLVLGSLNLLLGNKADKAIIRSGCKEAYVEAVFLLSDRQQKEIISETSLELDEPLLIISRKISTERNQVRINHETVTNKLLSTVGSYLVNICGQRDNAVLLNKDSHLRLLDHYAADHLKQALSDTASAFKEYKKCSLVMSTFDMNDEERVKKLDYLQYVHDEIDQASLVLGEDESLETDFNRMSNSLKINESLNFIQESARNIDVSEILKYLSRIREYDTELDRLYSKAIDLEEGVSELVSGIDLCIEDMNFSHESFQAVSNRLDLINHLKFKYGKSIEDILRFQEETQKEINLLHQYHARKLQAEKDLHEAEKKLDDSCSILSNKRREAAKIFCKQIKEILLELEFHYVEIEACFEKTGIYTELGYDKMGLVISLNKGEDLRPLEAVASGGELSRIMLAIKSLDFDDRDDRVLIFDEIDTGIGGKTALSIAGRMEKLSQKRQVISITHLASIAAAADHHYKIFKKEKEDRTNTYIEVLGEEESTAELARMIGGDETSSIAVDHAKELKKLLKGERV